MSATRPTTTLKDPDYISPHVDVDEWRDEPVGHRSVHGAFEGTDLRFSYYFRPEERYAGRFFQPILAVSGTDHAFGSSMLQGMGGSIEFAIDSGAYMVESNLGSLTPYPGDDGTVTGYRASAAAAEYSRILAAEMYGEHRPYGYCYGGSGGGYKTMSCMENTDVWDGGVPFIIGSPMSLPNVFAVPASTTYEVIDGQVFVPAKASDREGVQPTVEVTANGRARADVAVSEEVHFAAAVEAPPGTGTVVSAEWDFDGSGEFAVCSSVLDGSSSLLNITAAHTFTEPGTYFPALLVRTQRHSNMRKPHARIQNLGRVRVVVE